MYLSRIGIICLAMILVAIVGYWMGYFMAHRGKKNTENLEPGRVMPDTLRHPHFDPIQVIPARAARTLSGLNELVDLLMDSCFDQQGFPFNDLRRFCLSKLHVPYPNSLVDPWTLSKLNDIGFYFIRHVIPKCATTSVAEQEAIVWPPIVWSTTLNMLQAGTTMSSLGYFKADRSGSDLDNDGSQSDQNGSSNGTSPGSSSSGKGGGDGDKKSGGENCSVNGPCGQPCPTSCIDAALLSKSPAAAAAATSPTQKGALTKNLDATELAEWWSLFTEDQGGTSDRTEDTSTSGSRPFSRSSMRNIMQDYIAVGSPTDTKLDTYLKKEIIDTYFDPITRIPTQAFIAKFQGYTQGQVPMDKAHQNKLIDIVFYVMETIISGLPTSTKPSFDFTWRPIPRLSERH
jgi:hypothetical protein